MNRRGIDTLQFFGFMIILLTLGAGLVLGLATFYGQKYDFKEIDAAALAYRVEECVREYDFSSSEFDLMRDCRLNKKVIDEFYFVKLTSDEKSVSVGVLDYENQCAFTGAETNQAYPRCANSTFIQDEISYTLIAGSNQDSRGVYG